MIDAGIDVLSVLTVATAKAAATVVSQMQGKEWAIVPATESADPRTVVPIHLDGAATASFELAIPYSSALRVVELFLGDSPEPSPEFALTEEHIEILHEFIRQVMGLTVSQLRPSFGALTPSILPARLECSSPVSSRSQLSCGSTSILLEFQIPSKDIDALRAAASEICRQSAPAATDSADTSTPEIPSSSVRASLSTTEPTVVPESKIAKYLQERNFNLLLDIELQVSLRFGRREMLLKDILELSSGSVVELDRLVQEPVDLLLDRKVIARGEVVIIEGNYGVRVTEVAPAQQRIECLC